MMLKIVNGVVAIYLSKAHNPVMTDREVIELLVVTIGGTTKVGALLGVKPQTVQGWRARGVVPGAWRFEVRRVANQRAGAKLPMAWLNPRNVAA